MHGALICFVIVLVLGGCADVRTSDGVLRYAIGAGSGLKGQFDALYSMDINDGFVGSLIHEPLLATDDTLHYSNDGMATYTYDRSSNTITISLERDVYWHDGHPLSLDDLIFAYEVIAHPDYDGLRFSDQMLNIVGVKEYNEGRASTISGLVLSEDNAELTIYFHKLLPTTLMGGGFWTTPAPRHWLGEIPVSNLGKHIRTRKETLGAGPFTLSTSISGEAIRLRKFENYWQGIPLLEGIDLEVMNPELIPLAMAAGKFDIAPIGAHQLNKPAPLGYSYIPNKDSAGIFSYLGFRLGNKPNDHHIHSLALRRAIAHSIDYKTLSKSLYNSARRQAVTILPPIHEALHDDGLVGFEYSPALAKSLLDEAGFLDTSGDGMRQAPDGSPLVLYWATIGNETSDVYVAYKLQAWRDIGIDVRLYQGRSHDFNTYYSLLATSTDIDMFDAAWSVGYDPNPNRLWAADSPLNYTKYSSPNFEGILARLETDDMWEISSRKDAYAQWQHAFHSEIPAIPTMWRQDYTAVHDRVEGYNPEDFHWHKVRLNPIIESNY